MSANIGINSESILNDTITTCDHRNGSHEPEDNIDAIIIRGNNLNETYGREETNTGHHLSHNNDNNTPEEPLLDTTSTGDETQLTPHMKDRFRRRLRYYFMSPIDKWRSKRRLPFKLVVQVVKIICVTTQLLIYGYDMSGHLAQESNSMIAFRELLLANWDPVREVMAYPPSAGPYALYTRQDFYDGIDYAVRQFSNISESSIGSFGYAVDRSPTNGSNMSDVVIQRRHYRTGSAHPSDYRYEYDNEEVSDWVTIGELYPPGDERWFTQFSSQRYFDGHNFTINFDRLLWLEVVFPLRTIYVNSLAKYNAPKCYDLNVTIAYDNTEHDGQMPVHLTVTQRRHRCDGNLADNSDDESERQRRLAINWAVIVLSAVSAVLCLRSLYSGLVLCAESRQFFAHHFQQRLSFGDQMSFCDLWIVLIVINDALITTGTALKMRLEVEFDDSIQYNTVSILLGVGNLCVWTGFLRYLGFAHKYNVLILTLRRAIPNVLRFMLCALILYGYVCLVYDCYTTNVFVN
ncbi:unnamed protein product [Medioppia subpectinata]|uniref:Mucolipin extracytosolic domain-containing protein n=1 Tax=Medioppia subpectinata TaxID=1979941 RepID=A0A7R9KL83_9ACAR|nr:unnamed protein product [Medioppia subpectinata]CAG2105299.1 unnamed protein product [Medioppia subpectinata]